MKTRQHYIRLVHSQPAEDVQTRVDMRVMNWPIVAIIGGCIAYHVFALYCIFKIVESWGDK